MVRFFDIISFQTLMVSQGWKCSVKSRHFILSLQDYFTEKFLERDEPEFGSYVRSPSPAPSLAPSEDAGEVNSVPQPKKQRFNKDDKWTLAYINILHVQGLVEAFDDDGTGFITVKEVNGLTRSRPRHWR
jgi:hypothetical protein